MKNKIPSRFLSSFYTYLLQSIIPLSMIISVTFFADKSALDEVYILILWLFSGNLMETLFTTIFLKESAYLINKNKLSPIPGDIICYVNPEKKYNFKSYGLLIRFFDENEEKEKYYIEYNLNFNPSTDLASTECDVYLHNGKIYVDNFVLASEYEPPIHLENDSPYLQNERIISSQNNSVSLKLWPYLSIPLTILEVAIIYYRNMPH